MGDFVHLHVHSEYSFLDGLMKIGAMVEQAKSLGMTTLTLTDHGGMFGMYEFVTACKEAEIKPIVGCEMYVAKRARFDKTGKEDQKSYHLTVLAKNEKGYRNLIEMLSFSHIEGFYYKPRIDRELLEKYHEGLIVLSGCMQGELLRKILAEKEDDVKEIVKYYKDLFGDDYYFEQMRFGAEEDKILEPKIKELSKQYAIKRVATCDAHYQDKSQAKAQEVMWAISDGKRLDDPTRRQINSDQFYLKGEEEMRELWEDDLEVIRNTREVAEKCEVDISFNGFVLPNVDIPEKYGDDYDSCLKDRVYSEGKVRLGRKFIKEEKKRIDYELEVIRGKEMSKYFLLCADFATWMKEQDIFVNTRGSAAGSMVAYSLGIVNANPMKFQLLFERFLNPERPKAPDIDFDIESGRREEVIQHAVRKFGWSSVAYIITYDRMRTRAVLRDVGRVLGLPLEVVDRVSKLTPQSGQGSRQITLVQALEKVPELTELVKSDPSLQQLFEYATVLDGLSRHRGLHACGLLITPGPVWKHVPVVVDSDTKRLVTQYDFRALEDLGIVKLDFLGVENLDIIKDAIRLISETKEEKVDIDSMIDKFSFDDEKTYTLIKDRDTLGVFQLESDVMKKTLGVIQPEDIFDIGASLALVRPGPNAYQEIYGRRRSGKEPPEYLDPRMKDFLERSYGVLVYQEDLMKCVIELAGMSWKEADTFRKFTGKKIPEILLDQKDDLIKRFVEHGTDEKTANKLIELFLPFADYAFNEAHAASYSIVTYLTAFLKANFPVEYMAALYKAHLEDQEKLGKISEECRRKGIKILPPDINKSYEDFVIEGKRGIRFGLAGVKGVGRKVISHIVKVRGEKPFSSLDDLCSRIDMSKAPKSALEALVKVGAMDKFGKREALLGVLPAVAEKWQEASRLRRAGQSGLFNADVEKTVTVSTILPQVKGKNEKERLQWEKELLGTYISTHPAEKLYKLLKCTGVKTTIEVCTLMPGTLVKIVGVLDSVRAITTKNNKNMCFIDLQDHTGSIDVTVFPNLYEELKDSLKERSEVVVSGKIDNRGGNIGVLADKIYVLDNKKLKEIRKKIKKMNGGNSSKEKNIQKGEAVECVKVRIPKSSTMKQLKDLNSVFLDNPGESKVTIFIPNHKKTREVVLRDGIEFSDSVQEEIQEVVPGAKIEYH